MRGKSYINDRVKVAASETVGDVISFEMFRDDKKRFHCVADKDRRTAVAAARKEGDTREMFVINFIGPNPPYPHGVVTIAMNEEEEKKNGKNLQFWKLWRRFVDAESDEWRNNRFKVRLRVPGSFIVTNKFQADRLYLTRSSLLKVIPNIFEGAWVVSSAVGNTPALLGNKLKQSYFKGDGYFELDCDVGSSSVASWLVHLIQSYSTQLKIDLAFTIQGNSEDELPEKICGALRLCHLDIDAIPFVV